MPSNFAFLQEKYPALSGFGRLAEQYLYSDANSCLMKLGMLGETIVSLMFSYDDLPQPIENNAANRINMLLREELIDESLCEILHMLRKARNKAAHEGYDSLAAAKRCLVMAHSLCEWFMETYGDWSYTHHEFVMPAAQPAAVPIVENKAIEAQLIRATEATAQAAPAVPLDVRRQKAHQAASQRPRSEEETRYMIDAQLRKVGWEADSENLRYSKLTRPQKGRNLAIAEWPTYSRLGNSGRADYALFVGTQMIGIIESKAYHKDISSVIDYQGKSYPSSIREEDAPYTIGSWDGYKVPFTFATNGRPYLAQLETSSGIWFLDLRKKTNTPKALHGWPSPDGLQALLTRDLSQADKKLKALPYDLLRDPAGLNLRDYQIRAIQAAEAAVVKGQQHILLAMATGTGKTRTVLGMIYRFLKSGRFRRILFLVDRTSLGEQALDVFQEVKLEDLLTLDNIYDIKGLEDKRIDRETRIHVSTVQGMVRRLFYADDDTQPAITDYDLIIVDEAHCGYILDREMSGDDLLYRDQRDYQSKYRAVIDYFDAVKIGLTATPALQTTEIFGKPVFKYTYREAVIAGYLVDHDAPHVIKTRQSVEGIHYSTGDTILLYDPVTGELLNSEVLGDELDFDVEDFNRSIITEGFNRAVLEEIAKDFDPTSEEQGKMLIYAANDRHADLIVQILRELYAPQGVPSDAILKITGKAGGGDKKKIKNAILRFKNEQNPRIVVTVDLLTTGIDVPQITTLVFLRRVRSRILFEQMLGRATRLCPAIKKTHFEIYDAVGVYEAMEKVTTMKPVVTGVNTNFDDLLNGLEVMSDDRQLENQIDQIVAKFQRLKPRIAGDLLDHFRNLTGGQSPDEWVATVEKAPLRDAKAQLLDARRLLLFLEKEARPAQSPVVVDSSADEIVEHSRGYSTGTRPEDYLEEFSRFVQNNRNEIMALNIICTRPKDLIRESLRHLKSLLDSEGFTETKLNTAVAQMTNQEITADIISLIRRMALGSPLVSHETRIRRAVERLKDNHDFSLKELGWLNNIEKFLLSESVINMDTFNEAQQFKSRGGLKKINKDFNNQLENIVFELNEYLYDDGGYTA